MSDSDFSAQADLLVAALARHLEHTQRLLVCAESCTGGMVAAACTSRAGSSLWFDRGLVTYSNQAKTELLGVPAALIATHGAVSDCVARAMAEGALRHSAAQLSVAITGIAGPGGGVPGKPVGTVWFGWANTNGVHAEQQWFAGDRHAVRTAATLHALRRLLDF